VVVVEKIIIWSLKNSFLVLLFTAMVTFVSVVTLQKSTLDALPDLSPVQVIVQVKWEGQSPKIIEDQVTYPLITELMSLKQIKTVRAMSSFQNALCYVIFKEGVDIYDARERILEKLSELTPTFPKNAKVSMGSDATGVGWAYQYALTSPTKSLDELRTLQDYYYKYALLGVDGVSEVAPIGGFETNYQVTLKQEKLVEYDLSLASIIQAIQKNNNDRGGGVILENGQEQIIQAKGYIQEVKGLENITLISRENVPLKLSDIATVRKVPAPRRGMADLNGEGEVVGGIVIVRFGENPYKVIQAVKKRLASLQVADVEVVETYDRSSLIQKAIHTLQTTLVEESIIVMLIVLLFLFHMRSAFVIVVTLPLTVAVTFLLMYLFGIGSNIMSLGGIAIAIGAMVDATIVMVENAHKHLLRLSPEERNNKAVRFQTILHASTQVGRPIFFALLLIVVSFLPIFVLSGQEGKLFTPLAYTKTFAMMVGAILSITVVPILILFFVKGKILKEEENPVNTFFQALYHPILTLAMRGKYILLLFTLLLMVAMVPLYTMQKWEFMPMMDEENVMYMPVTPYGIGIDLAKELTQKSDKIIKSFPEVKSVFGKVGRADTATDPAPLSMIETFITFKEKSHWREGMTKQKLLAQLEEALQIPGLINSWTYPIRGRIDMLLTGIRTPLGIKLYGDDQAQLEETATSIELALKKHDFTLSVSSDKANSGYYLDVTLDVEAMAQYGVTKETILETVHYLIAGAKVSRLYQGIQRYDITLRLADNERQEITTMKEVLVKAKEGFFPLKTFATLQYKEGPSVIKSEKGLNVNFIYITPKDGVAIGAYKKEAMRLLEKLSLPEGFFMEWAGQSEYLESAKERLRYIVPLSLIVIFLLIFLALHNVVYTTVIFLTLPLALFGGLLYIDILNYNLSIAVVVGFLSLLGIAAETSIVMVIYLQEELNKLGETYSVEALKEAIYTGSVQRLRPKLMTVFAIILSLLPIMYISGVGSEIMRRIAAPMIGGMVSSTLLTLLVIPIVFYLIHEKKAFDARGTL
jgi:Cu(I)/Ag(I) efflux system membrane protein CusA/SilA